MSLEQQVYEKIRDNEDRIENHLETLLYREDWDGNQSVDIDWRDPEDGIPVEHVAREELASYQCQLRLPVRSLPSTVNRKNIQDPEGYLNTFLADEPGGRSVSLAYWGHEGGSEHRGIYSLELT